MAKGENQKLKISILTEIMLTKTDEDHGLTLAQIIKELENRGVSAERKSLYTDFNDMTDKLGVEIIKEQIGRETLYHVGAREFELAEVKLLIDAIQSSKFITEKKSRELIGKIKGLVSEHQASQLSRQVYVQGRAKTMNESIYYNVDDIHKAIAENKKISLKYYKCNTKKVLVERHDGFVYKVSPWALSWNDENYYLVAFDDNDCRIKHYRVDKMKNISILEEARAGKSEFKDFDMAKYSKMNFGMYSGNKTSVHIEFVNDMAGVFIDRFGKDIIIKPVDDEHSSTSVEVAVSPQFFGWICSLSDGVKITGPAEVKEEMAKMLRELLNNY